MGIVKKVVLLTISFGVALLLYLLFVSELITRYLFVISPTGQLVVNVGSIFVQGTVIYLFVKSVLDRKVDRAALRMLWVIYFLMLSVLLFLRSPGVRGIDLRPWSFVHNTGYTWLPFLAMNILLFVPIGYLLRKRGVAFALVFIALLELSIETAQYVFSVGFFDAGDIVLNAVGILIGYFYFRQKTPSSSAS